jgi:hypothetical protein
LNMIWASVVKWGAEWNGQAIFKAADIGMIKRRDPAD